MSKIRLNLTLSASPYSQAEWVIDKQPEAWDVTEQVEMDVEVFTLIAKGVNNKEDLAEHIMAHVRQEKERAEYEDFINELLTNNVIED